MTSQLKFIYLLSALLLISAWLIPNHYFPWAAFYNDIFATLAVFALAISISLNRYPLALPRSAIFVFSLALIPLLQFGFGLIYFLGDALITGFYLAALGFAIVIGANLTKIYGTRFVEGLAWVCLIGALISVALALHQWLGLEQLGNWLMDMPPGDRPYANLAQPNNLATLLGMGLAAAVYLRERGYFGRLVLALLALMLLVGIAMTQSRMTLFTVIAIAGWMVWGHKRFKLKCSMPEAVAGLSVFIPLWFGWTTISGWLYLPAQSAIERLAAAGGEVRLVFWQQLIDAVSRQWLYGYGWNQVSVAQVSVAAEYPSSLFVEYSHNFIIDLLIWNGVVLGGAVLAAMGWWFIVRIRRVSSIESWFALLLIVVVGIHSMFEYPHAYAYFLLPIGLCVGIVEFPDASNAPRLPRWAFVAATLVGITLIIATFFEYQRVESDHRLMRLESAGIERRQPLSKAPDVVMLTQLREFIRLARTAAHEGMSEDEIDWMRKVAHRYPYPPALFRYALALGLNHHPREAEIELRRLKQLHPRYYEGARIDWQRAVKKYPQLAQIVFPS